MKLHKEEGYKHREQQRKLTFIITKWSKNYTFFNAKCKNLILDRFCEMIL